MEKYNLVVVGAGSAGLVVAVGAAGLGARVALVESGKMGGDCLNYGCVPSKTLVAIARAAKQAGALTGKSAADFPEFSWPAVAGRVQAAIDAIAPHDSVERIESLGIEVFAGRGRLASPTRVEVELTDGTSRALQGKSLVIATGSSPAVPPVPGLKEAGYLTNETVFTMPELPRRMLVMGGGAIGCDLGQCLARLGAEVTLVEMLPSILNQEDPDVSREVGRAMETDGMRIVTDRRVARVELENGGKKIFLAEVSGRGEREESLVVDAILVAAGRQPNVRHLGLENAGVAFGKKGVQVNRRLQTSIASVYACGDVAGPYLFTHMANQQARVVIQNAMFPLKTRIDYRVVPWCIFSDPEVARVGLNETEAGKQGVPYRVTLVPFSGIDRAVCEQDTRGFLKVLTPPGRDDILGVSLVGSHAGELIHEMVLAMQERIGLNRLAKMVHVYPTRAEILRRAADERRKAGFTPRLQSMFRSYLGWRRRGR